MHLSDRDRAEISAVAALKGERRISVCIPCRDEAATIGSLVAALRSHAVDETALVDELIVVDDRSTDHTAELAEAAGARVVHIDTVHERYGTGAGKGNVLWSSLLVSEGDVVVWLDGDVTTASARWVARLAEPLLRDPVVGLVKASYVRSTAGGGGGRTTELVVRPMLSLLAPELTWIDQPLAGEMAVRRDVVESIPMAQGWGVEIAMVLDVVERFGVEAVTQVDLGERRHRHRDLLDLRLQAAEVMATLLGRLDIKHASAEPALALPDGTSIPLNLDERPPVHTVR